MDLPPHGRVRARLPADAARRLRCVSQHYDLASSIDGRRHLVFFLTRSAAVALHACRDGDDEGGGGEALHVAEPPVRRRLHEQEQLRERLQDGGLPVGRVQVARHRAQVPLQADLLVIN